MKITYGYDTLPEKDPVVALVNEATAQFEDVTESSKVWLVDIFPIRMFTMQVSILIGMLC